MRAGLPIALARAIAGCGGGNVGLFSKKKLRVEDQLVTLGECGITMNKAVSLYVLCDITPREQMEQAPYKALVETLAWIPRSLPDCRSYRRFGCDLLEKQR